MVFRECVLIWVDFVRVNEEAAMIWGTYADLIQVMGCIDKLTVTCDWYVRVIMQLRALRFSLCLS